MDPIINDLDAMANGFLQEQLDAIQDRSMMVLPEERQWALEIKQAVNEAQHLEPLSDFDCVHMAMITRGNTPEALFRVQGMQEFRREYGVDSSLRQGAEVLERTMHLMPGFLLHLDNCPDTNEGILVWDASIFKPALLLSPSKEHGVDYYWKTYVVTCYYLYIICQPDLASIREGLTLILDCGRVEWDNVSMDFEKRMHDELRAYYPLKWKKILAYNTATIANVGWSLYKQFMNPHMRNCLQLGCQIICPDPTVSSPTYLYELFLQPSLEESQFNILRRAVDLLTIRAENVRSFKL